MARIRTIKPEFWEDEKIGLLSHGARLLFLGCLNLADDEGLLRWNEMYLGSSIFPYDDIKAETVRKWMTELENQEIIFPYVGGQTRQKLGWVVNFHKHQRIDKPQPSKFPAPSLQNSKVQLQYYKRDNGICAICGGDIDLHGNVKSSGSKVLSLDHIKHRVNGGNDHPSNIRAVHLSCNKSRGCKEDSELNFYSPNDSENDSKNCSLQEGKGKEGKVKEEESESQDEPAPGSSLKTEKKINEKKLGAAQPELFQNPFADDFLVHWALWKQYKKEQFRFSFKSVISEQASINDLVALSKGNEQIAIAIIKQSIAKGCKGFFELKDTNNGNSKNGAGQQSAAKVSGGQLNEAFTKFYNKG